MRRQSSATWSLITSRSVIVFGTVPRGTTDGDHFSNGSKRRGRRPMSSGRFAISPSRSRAVRRSASSATTGPARARFSILSKVTTPTSGEIRISGRLSALIEVGSGFHPELTGRENIYLRGSILGMRRREIVEKLERIIEFAGVRDFIDSPVKHYSSGMYVRLGFSIAAHLEPEILLLDEVLAVGDATFQAKCLGRINQLHGEGRTIVFISHDLDSVQRLCARVLLLNHRPGDSERIRSRRHRNLLGNRSDPSSVGTAGSKYRVFTRSRNHRRDVSRRHGSGSDRFSYRIIADGSPQVCRPCNGG